MTDDALTSRANVVLHLDNGAEMQFSGRPFAGGSWFDDETGELTRQKLYTTESGEHVYSIVTGKGQQRSRRAYRVSLHGEACTINDGRTEMHPETKCGKAACFFLTHSACTFSASNGGSTFCRNTASSQRPNLKPDL